MGNRNYEKIVLFNINLEGLQNDDMFRYNILLTFCNFFDFLLTKYVICTLQNEIYEYTAYYEYIQYMGVNYVLKLLNWEL